MEYNEYALNNFEWDILNIYIKYGCGNFKLYNITFFSNLADETACMTLLEFSEKAVDYDDFPWNYK